MPAATTEELGDDLDANFSWRRTELHALRSEIESLTSENESLPRGRALLRAGVALLYAHWEGFAKETCQSYLDYVARRNLKGGQLNDSFVLLALDRAVRRASSDVTARPLLLEFVRRGQDMQPHIPRRDVVDTANNLRHRVLCDLLTTLGLPSDPFDMRQPLIDRSLCDARNDIAHGRALFIGRSEYLTLDSAVLDMMDAMRDIVLAAARTGGYRKVY